MRSRMEVAIRVDSHPQMGAGHVMRCLTLANRLYQKGLPCRFYSASISENLERQIIANGHSVCHILSPVMESELKPGWEVHKASSEAQAADWEACKARMSDEPNLVVVDHYLLDNRWERQWHKVPILVVDDLADRKHQCSVLLDQTYGRQTSEYLDLVPDGAAILTGTDFALLRREFADHREQARKKRETTSRLSRVLVNFGAADVGRLTLRVVQGLLLADEEFAIHAICSSQSADIAQIEDLAAKNSRLTLESDTKDMAKALVEADLAIGAAGSTSWERCCLALPSILIKTAENQRSILKNLAESGAALVAADPHGAVVNAVALLEDLAKWRAMARNAFAVCDGLGAERVADALLSKVEMK